MTSLINAVPRDPVIRAAGGFALVSGFVSAIGVAFLIAMFVLSTTPLKVQGLVFGLLNDICVAIQYLLTIPIALALHRILLLYSPTLIRVATSVGIAAMLIIIMLQLALVFVTCNGLLEVWNGDKSDKYRWIPFRS